LRRARINRAPATTITTTNNAASEDSTGVWM
jgi:hypothetical protein